MLPPSWPAPHPSHPAPQPGIQFVPDDQLYQPSYPPEYNNTYRPVETNWSYHDEVAQQMTDSFFGVAPYHNPGQAESSGTSFDYAQ